MHEDLQYRWSTKLKKFNITNPFLKFIASKYENEILWQTVVRDEVTLNKYIEKVMIPKFLEKIELPQKMQKKHFYISDNHISLDASLNGEENENDEKIQAIKVLRKEEGDSVAVKALVNLINKRKQAVFKKWIRVLDKNYPEQFAFKLLLLRPLFELAGYGSRRTVIDPSIDTIAWIYLRIERGRLLPNENVAFQYCLKQGNGTAKKISHGWQFVPSGVRNVPKLNAISSGSGWCIAGNYYANVYLKDCDFYVLRSNNKPVVALRILQSTQCVLECRGRYNFDPKEWWVDIWLFLETIDIDPLFRQKIKISASLDTENWWKERVKLWSFSALLAPEIIKNTLLPEIQATIFQYTDFKNFPQLVEHIGIATNQSFWAILIEKNPYNYDRCPTKFKEFDGTTQACIDGWLSYMEDDQLGLHEIECIPDFVKKDNVFADVLNNYFPASIKKAIRKLPATRSERAYRFTLDDVLPVSTNESAKIACERMLNTLLNNQNGIFSDDIFSETERQREDFKMIREKAWLEGIQAHPPLWFALPLDLKNKQVFQLNNKPSAKVDIHEWIEKVHHKPWLLTQRTTVPKSIRFHIDIMKAYRDGWLCYLKQYPWRIWVKHGSGIYSHRTYMSYALLSDSVVIDTLAQGWARMGDRLLKTWRTEPSERMKLMPAIQLSILRAISSEWFAELAVEYKAVAILIRRDIEDNYWNDKLITHSICEEIKLEIYKSRQLYGK